MRERKNIEKIQKIENDETLTNTRKKIFENQQIKSRDSVNRKHVSQFILRKNELILINAPFYSSLFYARKRTLWAWCVWGDERFHQFVRRCNVCFSRLGRENIEGASTRTKVNWCVRVWFLACLLDLTWIERRGLPVDIEMRVVKHFWNEESWTPKEVHQKESNRSILNGAQKSATESRAKRGGVSHKFLAEFRRLRWI